MHKYVSFLRFGVFSMIAAMLMANPSAKAESYTLPGESSKPSAEEFIGTPGLVGIFYGHLPRDGHPRQKVTLVLLADPQSGAPKGYVLERIGVAKMPDARLITKGSRKLIRMQTAQQQSSTNSIQKLRQSSGTFGKSTSRRFLS
jgi:hypothetical protein